jgi:hypothetical protein
LIEGNHTAVTTWYQGWSGLKNGALLTEAEKASFDLFVTADQELTCQQNLTGRKMAVLVLGTNNWELVKAGIAEIMAAIDAMTLAAMPRLKFPSRPPDFMRRAAPRDGRSPFPFPQ